MQILRNTVSAMKPGYSKLVLNEVILPVEKCPWQHAALDIIMMTSFSGRHRSETHWRSLLSSAGLTHVTFWYPPDIGDGVIVATRELDPRTREPTYHSTNANYTLPNE